MVFRIQQWVQEITKSKHDSAAIPAGPELEARALRRQSTRGLGGSGASPEAFAGPGKPYAVHVLSLPNATFQCLSHQAIELALLGSQQWQYAEKKATVALKARN